MAVTGKGMQAQVDGHRVLAGNAALLTDAGIAAGPLSVQAERLATAGKTPMYVAVDGQAAGVVAVADTIRSRAPLLVLMKSDPLDVVRAYASLVHPYAR